MQHTLAPNPLIARIAEGECDALTALYARDGAWVYALACRFVSEEDVAADVVEEVFDVLWDEITENGLPDIGTRPWLIWLTRARARTDPERRCPSKRSGLDAAFGWDAVSACFCQSAR